MVSEGYVVRTAAAFDRAEFATHIGNHVRHGHVTTDTLWAHQAIVPNRLDHPGYV